MIPSASQASYAPGTWVAIATNRAWLLMDLVPEHELVERCWAVLSADARAEAILDVLLSGGIVHLPDFALVSVWPDERRAIVRGRATVRISLDGHEDVTVMAGERSVWEDRLVDGGSGGLLLASGEPLRASVELPMSSGVTAAGTVRIQIDTAADPIEGAGEPIETEVGPLETAGAGQPTAGEDLGLSTPAPSYDHLFGATERPTAPPEEPVLEPAAGVPALGEAAGWLTLPPEAAPPLTPPAPAWSSGSGLIDGVPWLSDLSPELPSAPVPAPTPDPLPPPSLVPVRPAETPTPQPIDEPPSEVARTVDRSALLAEAAPTGLQIPGPTVLAGYCANGHLSPPHAARCRVCGVPMTPQPGFEMARPPLGVLRLSTGDVVTLDRGVLMGRAPEAAGNDEQRPNVLRLSSPENDISRNHAEVVLDGWHVYVRDLGSTNGTVVTLPGQPPVRLRANDLQLLEHGTAVTLADEVTLTFEVLG